ncbi:DNA-binding regulatory protein, YebC/PmpR family [Desulfonispora thiosulfatigenes DSM 11270]|uniref:Probable transcriptional regulatory protein SAMN00017405_0472 n=1 Tax=Desulfonispora thiosulfatigenes DSM 11270 TaxID=656914 RepID=A0A1W1VRL5_DESTI|nr:YebC/PmpR family DNA-binding transcriptional regulator [Desulfonispora thiosulfatigenes]SMB95741.1 DNA-binding regulatory protein, YebC/PmpR family [Desulfonispora thiosulfatigenes DSM 11270]
MAGHSKWANIKHRKTKQDAQKGKIFTKLAREIIVAAKQGGGDPDGNFRLRIAVDKAKINNMPNDNIKRAIQKGIGSNDGDNYEEVTYEGYGPGGVAITLDIMTDNRNRTAGDIRYLFSKNGGNMGETGCVSYMFDRKGYLLIESPEMSEDELMLMALEAGAEDINYDAEAVEIYTDPDNFELVKGELEKGGIEFTQAEVTLVPQNTVEVTDQDQAKKLIKLIDAFEEHDDVQGVFSNADIPDEIMEQL